MDAAQSRCVLTLLVLHSIPVDLHNLLASFTSAVESLLLSRTQEYGISVEHGFSTEYPLFQPMRLAAEFRHEEMTWQTNESGGRRFESSAGSMRSASLQLDSSVLLSGRMAVEKSDS